MTESLFYWYLDLNLLLAFAYLLWLGMKPLSRWPALRLDGNTQLSWARLVFACAALSSALIAVAPQGLSLLPWAQTLKAGIVDEWTSIAGTRTAFPRQDTGWQLQQWLFAALLVGWLWQLANLARQLRQLKHVVASSTPWKQAPKVHVLVSSSISVPFATRALGKCLVVLPEQLVASPKHWRLATQHEFQHARNGDLDWLLWLEALQALCFWNPCMHLWRREFEVLQELACDETLVVERRVDAEAYGNCLLEVAQYRAMPTLVGASSMVPLLRWFRNNNTLLRRRIMKLGNVRKERNSRAKNTFYGAFMIAALSSGSLLIAADLPDEPDLIIPSTRVNPEYPLEALEQAAEGWVQLSFNIDAQGSVHDAKVVKSCAGPKDQPCIANEALFADAALDALQQWRYEVQGKARNDVQTIIRFQLGDE